MFAKLIFIWTVFTFVYVRSVQCCESEAPSLLDSSGSNTDMNTHPTKTKEQKLIPEYKLQENWQAGHATVTTPHHSDTLPGNHMHHGTNHPKKRTTNYKQNRRIDLRPGCCG